MKRTRYDSEYERIRREAGLAKPQYDFPDDDPAKLPQLDTERVKTAHADFKARMEVRTQYEIEQAAKRKVEADELSARANESLRLAEFDLYGVEPPDGMRVSLPLLISLGWTIEEVEGQKVLVRPQPSKQPRSRREDYEAST
jgi:hypothetical protein